MWQNLFETLSSYQNRFGFQEVSVLVKGGGRAIESGLADALKQDESYRSTFCFSTILGVEVFVLFLRQCLAL